MIENANDGNDAVYASIDYRLGANVEYLLLQGGAVQGYGNSSSNAIVGNTGNNLLNGEGGADSMYGGAGNDVYFVDNAGDVVIENVNEGNDTVYASIDYGLTANVDNLILQGSANLQAYGNNGVNALFGNSGNNILNGEGGADHMFGGAGNDVYVVDNVGDLVVEAVGAGNDTVYASVNYALTANVDNLILQEGSAVQATGNSGVNAIFGNSGNNTLDGGGGADVLIGGAGNDTFVFNVGQANGDTIIDFGATAPAWRLPEFRRLRHGRAGGNVDPDRREQPVADPFRYWRRGRDHHLAERRMSMRRATSFSRDAGIHREGPSF